MSIAAIQIVLGLFFLYLGAEALVRGSVGLSVRLGIPKLIVGLTVVAFATGSPELIVGDGGSDLYDIGPDDERFLMLRLPGLVPHPRRSRNGNPGRLR